jgi:hypothetical protein
MAQARGRTLANANDGFSAGLFVQVSPQFELAD